MRNKLTIHFFILLFLIQSNFSVLAKNAKLNSIIETNSVIIVDKLLNNINNTKNLLIKSNKYCTTSYQLFTHSRPSELFIKEQWKNLAEIATCLKIKNIKSKIKVSVFPTLNVYILNYPYLINNIKDLNVDDITNLKSVALVCNLVPIYCI